jgi:hypothetical protein
MSVGALRVHSGDECDEGVVVDLAGVGFAGGVSGFGLT